MQYPLLATDDIGDVEEEAGTLVVEGESMVKFGRGLCTGINYWRVTKHLRLLRK